MKKVFSKFMTIAFAASLALFVTLGIIVIILGPDRTEKAIKSLFNFENYKEDYKKILPFLSEVPDVDGKSKKRNVLGSYVWNRSIGDRSEMPSLLVPSSGTIPRAAFLYTGLLSEGLHEGIDIWTNLNGTGMDGQTYGRGNPVYASCDGYVHNIWIENGDVSIICDPLDEIYKDKLPSLKIKTLYGHMADQFSDNVYIYVEKGQRVNKGDLIGHQGNRCFWAPQNIVVHLHFGVYDISVTPQVPMDPTPYIGVGCTTLNQLFEASVEK